MTTQSENILNQNNQDKLIAEDNLLILHTKVGCALFNGDWRINHMGLTQFASLVKKIWRAHRADDPYADLYLLKISDAIKEARKKLEEYEKTLQQQITELRGFKFNLYGNPTPYEYKLKFVIPYSYMAAILVEKVDYINRHIFTLKHLGIIPANNLTSATIMREAQNVYRISANWKYTGVTRQDILDNNPIAKKALLILGELPIAVLNKEIKSLFLNN